MKIIQDYQQTAIRLTNERLRHTLEHPEMAGAELAIEETLTHPQRVVQSSSDDQVRLYYRLYLNTRVGDKYLCTVVKMTANDAFVITAYFTDSIKKGTVLWVANQ